MTIPSKSGSINADRIGFFFGAGSSIEFGIPSMKQMTTTFAKKMRSKVGQKKMKKEVFNTIYNSLVRVYGKDNVDLEAIMSVIAGLKEKERLKDNIGDLGLFILERKGIINYVNQFKYNADILDNLEDEFKEHIRNKVVIDKPRKIDLARSVYSDFFKQLCVVTNCDNPNDEDSEHEVDVCSNCLDEYKKSIVKHVESHDGQFMEAVGHYDAPVTTS